jgi:hypothetical protein
MKSSVSLRFAPMRRLNSARRKIGARLAPVCFDSKHPSHRQESTDKPNVMSKIEPRRVATDSHVTNTGPRNVRENSALVEFWEVGAGVHICNTYRKKDCDKASQDKFKLPFGP